MSCCPGHLVDLIARHRDELIVVVHGLQVHTIRPVVRQGDVRACLLGAEGQLIACPGICALAAAERRAGRGADLADTCGRLRLPL